MEYLMSNALYIYCRLPSVIDIRLISPGLTLNERHNGDRRIELLTIPDHLQLSSNR